MKVLSLNIWGGHISQPLISFIEKHADVDVICLQEVYHEATVMASDEERYVDLLILSKISERLPEHSVYFRPVVNNSYGIAMLVKNNVDVISEKEYCIFNNPDYSGIGPRHSRILQSIECRVNNKDYAIVNLHGLWNGKGKHDSQERVTQSVQIKNVLEQFSVPTVLCGDFNLRPDTKSMRLIEEGMINLIKKYNIASTRTSYYLKQERFADYILITPDIAVKQFCILPDEVSDHAPMYIEFI